MRALAAAAAAPVTRDLSDIRSELREFRNRGSEDPGVRWRCEKLEQEEARALAKHSDRALTDSEAEWFEQRLHQIVADATAGIYKHIEKLQQAQLDGIADAFARQNRKNRDALTRHIDEHLAKLKTGPAGPRGEKGARGEYGARGIQGKEGPQGKRGSEILSWRIDKTKYTATPVMDNGSPGAELELRELFQQFLRDVR
jgi:hypothetical protein